MPGARGAAASGCAGRLCDLLSLCQLHHRAGGMAESGEPLPDAVSHLSAMQIKTGWTDASFSERPSSSFVVAMYSALADCSCCVLILNAKGTSFCPGPVSFFRSAHPARYDSPDPLVPLERRSCGWRIRSDLSRINRDTETKNQRSFCKHYVSDWYDSLTTARCFLSPVVISFPPSAHSPRRIPFAGVPARRRKRRTSSAEARGASPFPQGCADRPVRSRDRA